MKRDEKDLAAMVAALKATFEARQLVGGFSAEVFAADRVKGLALERLLQRIADAAQRVSRHAREAHTEVPWDRLDLLRETVSTAHDQIDPRVLFAIVTREGSMLIDAIERALPSDAD
jgi:uncharacterized protein with HEPN domain